MAFWKREELLLALDLYLRTPFGKQHSSHPPIIELANRLGRSPSAISMKLNNLTSLDPEEKARGIRGLANASRLDTQVWNEYNQDPVKVAIEIERLINPEPEGVSDESFNSLTEIESIRRVRLQQNFFRRIVLNTYDIRCCITDNPIPDLLRASHIIPWSQSEKERLNPRNGLCLAATFDVAFDRGLFWIDEEFRIQLTPRILNYEKNVEIADVFLRRNGAQLRLPEKNLPDSTLLKWHRDNIALIN